MRFDVFDYTNQGGRSYNEDSVGFTCEGDSGLFVVADGLGGHMYGEVASKCVCDTLIGNWSGRGMVNLNDWLSGCLDFANGSVLELQKEKGAVLKSTAVVLAVDNGRAVWSNVGDSRLYYIHNSEIASYTRDHSVAFKKFRAGEITRDDIRTDEDQSSLLRSIGNEELGKYEKYTDGELLTPGDAFMLCSDGVWEYLSDEEIVIDLLKSENSKQWAELMLLRLMDRINGENDNLTLLTIMVN